MAFDAYAVVALVQDRVFDRIAQRLADHRPGKLAGEGDGGNLLEQLLSGAPWPRQLRTGELQNLGMVDLDALLPPGSGPLALLRKLSGRVRRGVENVLEARSWDDAVMAARDLISDESRTLAETLLPALVGQLGILLSLVTTIKNIPRSAPAVENALLRYFFSETGYVTLEGISIVAPVHLGDVSASGGQMRGLLSEGTGERYLRDLVRLMVEAADDVRYNDLQGRARAMRVLVDDHAPNLDRWLKGFGALAESSAMGAVEQAVLGVSQFQTNALIAAAAGTFAGTAARKAAQHVFLGELEFWWGQRHA